MTTFNDHIAFNEHLDNINQFQAHYQYDTAYMKSLLESSLTGYQTFADFFPMAHYREHLCIEDYWVAKLSSMRKSDCGECLQLNIKMAQEQGIQASLIKAVLFNNEQLTAEHQLIKHYVQQMMESAGVDKQTMSTMQAFYSEGELLEFGIAVSSAIVFPTIKRAIGIVEQCSIPEIEVA